MPPQKFIGGAERARRQAQSRGWEPPSQKKRRLEKEAEQKQRRKRQGNHKTRRESSVPQLSTKKLRSSERFFASLLDAPNYKKASIPGLVTICERRLGLGPPPLNNGRIHPSPPHTDNPRSFFSSRAILVMEEARYVLQEALHKNSSSSWIQMRPISFDVDEKRTGFLKVGLSKSSGRFSPEQIFQQRPGSCFEMEVVNKSTRYAMLCSVAPGKPGSKLVLTIYERASMDRLLSLLCGDEDPLAVSKQLRWNIRFITSLLSHCRQFEACDFGCSRHHKRAALLKEIMGQKKATHIRFGDSDNSDEEIVGYITEDGDCGEDDENNGDGQLEYCDNGACEKKQRSKLHLSMSSFEGLKALNPTQQMAADKFCSSDEDKPMLELIQGPPGTGKTTFVVSVLARLLCSEGEKRKRRRILVTAPTNKAVGVIAKRFLESCPCLLDQGVPISMIGVKDKLLEPDDDGNVDRNLSRIFCYTWLDTLAEEYQSLQLSFAIKANHSSLDCTPGNRSVSQWLSKAVPSSKNETFMVGDDSDSETEEEEEEEGSSNRPALQSRHHFDEQSASLEKAKGLYLRLIRNLPQWSEASGAANLSRKIVEFLKDGDLAAASAYIKALINILKDDSDDESNDGDEDYDDDCDNERGIKAADAIPELLATARVVFCTLSTAGTSLMKQTRRFDDWIVDEAAAATEPELLIPLHLDPQRLLVVGDPKQLPATVSSPLAEQLGLGRSLHERLTVDLGKPQTMLDIQYRMKPEIAKFPSQQFYGGKLVDGENVKEATYGSLLSSSSRSNGWDIIETTPPFCFFQLNGKEQQSHTGSYYNKEEACALVTLLKAIRERFQQKEKNWCSPDKIRVITFYSAQVMVLRQALRKEGLQGVLVATVDSSQGCEADLVVLSFVRTTRAGFLRDDRRMNVALTRARHKLVCLGNIINSNWACGESSSSTLTNLLVEANARGCVSTALAAEGNLSSGR